MFRSKLFSSLLAAGLAAPAAAQVLGPYALVHSNYEHAAAIRSVAVQRCAASIVETSAAALSRLDVIGYGHPVNGNLRVHGAATFADSARPVGFSCDVDSSGKLKRLRLDRAG